MKEGSENGTQPSQDPINPEWNRWLREESGKPPATKGHAQAATVQSLAARLGVDPEALAERIPADTLRRLKYPMLERIEPDGTRSYEHDLGIIIDGRRALLATDRGDEPSQKPSKPRNERGQFSK